MRLAPYPHPRFWMRVLDRVALAAGVIGPIMVVPQVWEVYATHAAANVSFASWAAFALTDIPLFFYGFAHRDVLIMTTYSLYFVLNSAVALGVVLYS